MVLGREGMWLGCWRGGIRGNERCGHGVVVFGDYTGEGLERGRSKSLIQWVSQFLDFCHCVLNSSWNAQFESQCIRGSEGEREPGIGRSAVTLPVGPSKVRYRFIGHLSHSSAALRSFPH